MMKEDEMSDSEQNIMHRREVWINDNSNYKFQKIKMAFTQAMQEQSTDQKINYYDFLLVAKKLSFRFEESGHLMNLKNYFAKNKNAIAVKKMADLLLVSQECMHAQEQKIIVKFTVPQTEFAPIKQATHEDEQDYHSEDEVGGQIFEKMGTDASNDDEREINEKMAIILTIKVDEMQKKVKALANQKEKNNLIVTVKEAYLDELSYDEFKEVVLGVLGEIREKVKMSEDDIKTIFYVLDGEKTGKITPQSIERLRNVYELTQDLRQFYRSRINKDMVRNTLFKLGKVKNNTIQIYQVKNASVMEFENIEKAIVEEDHRVQPVRLKPSKLPHFGPLKGAAMAAKQRQTMPSQAVQHRSSEPGIRIQREKIQRILRVSKQEKRRDKRGDTVASKLRSLFIHKVILPREKMLQQEKQRYLKGRGVDSQLFVRAHK